jgi:hypothetical protein
MPTKPKNTKTWRNAIKLDEKTPSVGESSKTDPIFAIEFSMVQTNTKHPNFDLSSFFKFNYPYFLFTCNNKPKFLI